MGDTRLKLAVFIDFDNIEIGVKSTLGTQFDIGVVLEALKERGEVVSKIAYGDWTRAGDYSRSLTQHATKLVQRNLTPGGDKNGADINLALDALEMAFTHSHINAYVIVGGDSDFITLVEKLKQYDKQTFVVGGRAFTSVVMQRNCHEFIAYENLVTSRRSADRRQTGPVSQAPIDQALPLVRRALKVLSDREVSPQLGLLKSTLLQLDSTFSERTYGVSSFRDFAQKLASAGHVRLREHGRNVLVELADGNGAGRSEDAAEERREAREPREGRDSDEGPAPVPRAADGIREVRRIFQSAPNPPRFPMYVRQAKQFMRAVDPAFDERKFGFGNLQDLLRACQREGLFRIERDRQGVIRLFAGTIMQPVPGMDDDVQDEHDAVHDAHDVVHDGHDALRDAHDERHERHDAVHEGQDVVHDGRDARHDGHDAPHDRHDARHDGHDGDEYPGEPAEVVDGDVVQELNVHSVMEGEEAESEGPQPGNEAVPPPARRRRGGGTRTSAQPRSSRKAAGEASGAAPRARKTPARPRGARAKKPSAD